MITDDCWHYAGIKHTDGYGLVQAKLEGKWKLLRAHRVMYENLRGAIPEHLVCDHLCVTRICINPDHIELVSNAENTRRANHIVKTHCKRGHPFDKENTQIFGKGKWRRCKTCQYAAQRRYKYKRSR